VKRLFLSDTVEASLSSYNMYDAKSQLPLFLSHLPNRKHTDNIIASAIQRFCRKMPVPEVNRIADFEAYAKALIMKEFKPLENNEVKTTEDWLDSSSYSGRLKKHFADLLTGYVAHSEDLVKNKSFIKSEGYEKPKFPRSINSYTDLSKALLGPLMSSIDNKVFAMPWFVKGRSAIDRPRMMYELFGHQPVMSTDFTSFEAHHQGVFAELGVFWIMHMCRNVGTPHFRRCLARMLRGDNVCDFGGVVVTILQRLMSGAMWTSSLNSVLNFLLMSYLKCRTRDPVSPPEVLARDMQKHFIGLIEGDDGICLGHECDEKIIAGLGIVLKPEKFENFGTASFCGVVCDIVELKIVSDPRKFLRNFFVMPQSYTYASDKTHHAMLRARALSAKYMLNDCPIIGPVCHKVCELTKSYDPRKCSTELDPWKRDLLELGMDSWKKEPNVSIQSRLLVEKLFGIDVQSQIHIEKTFGSSDGRCYLNVPHLQTLEEMLFIRDFVAPHPIVTRAPEYLDPRVLKYRTEGRWVKEPRVAKKARKEYAVAIARELIPRDSSALRLAVRFSGAT